ncbi:MAG: helix-turn-helix domain-containing protein [Planctomycetes bacterium]|nr:helix-turn-helix domain-containing protein [Planctomycetota bacterium]
MSTATSAKPDRRYMNLVHHFPLRPIRSKRELGRAMKIAGHLATHDEGTLPRGEQDYLDTLTVLIEDYQRRHPLELPEVTPLAMLKHLMEQHNMNVTELGRVVGSQSNASLILSGKRAISKRVMRLLSERFGVVPGVFL